VPWNSDFFDISAWDRRRSQGARPPEYSMYFKVAQRSERRRDRVEICGKLLIQGTRSRLWEFERRVRTSRRTRFGKHDGPIALNIAAWPRTRLG